MSNLKLISLFAFVFTVGILLIGFVSAEFSVQGSGFSSTGNVASYVSYGNPSASTNFYSSSDLNSYWPILGNREDCQSRQDMILQVAPFGCEPAVVRSDLLEEQNVPVFCQISALKLNPSIDIKEVKNIRFTSSGKTPAIVAGTGFHPANAALKSSSELIGSPLTNNVGYAVIILKKTPNESAMPDDVSINLTAQIQLDASNSLGIGRAEFILNPMTDEQWNLNKMSQSFWQGRYYIRLDEAAADSATVSIYQGNSRVTTQKVQLGKTSSEIYLPGLYCRAGLQIDYSGYVAAAKKAKIEVSSSNGVDSFEVYEGSKFLNDACTVNSISIDPIDGTGSILAYCGSQTIKLITTPKLLTSGDLIPASANLKIAPIARDNTPRAQFNTGLDKAKTFVGGSNIEACEAQLKVPSVPNSGYEGYYSIQRNVGGGSLDWELYRRTSISEYRGDSMGKEMQKDGNQWMLILKKEFIAKCEARDSGKTLLEKVYPVPAEGNVQEAINTSRQVASDYPSEAEVNSLSYGEKSLKEAIDFAGEVNKQRTKGDLINQFLQTYPNADAAYVNTLSAEKDKLYNVDLTKASQVVGVNNIPYTVKLLSLDNPKKDIVSAEFSWGGKTVNLGIGDSITVPSRYGGENTLTLSGDLMDINTARVAVTCSRNYVDAAKDSVALARTDADKLAAQTNSIVRAMRSTDFASSFGWKLLKVKQSEEDCGETLSLEKVNLGQVAKIRLTPLVKNLQEEVNVSVRIGIEKRAIQLTPEETESRINTLNETLKTMDRINDNLKTVVSGLKAACFATSAVLTAKTFLTGMSGEGIARQQMMKGDKGWDQKCQDFVSQKKYTTISQCFSENSAAIDADVKAYASGINAANTKLKQIEDNHLTSSSFGGTKTVDVNASAQELIDTLRREYPDRKVTLTNGKQIPVSEWLSPNAYSSNDVSYQELRDTYTAFNTQGLSETGQARVNSDLTRIAQDVNDRTAFTKMKDTLAGSNFADKLGLKGKNVYSYGSKNSQQGYYDGGSSEVDVLDSMGVKDAKTLNGGKAVPSQMMTYDNRPYLVLMKATSSTGQVYTAQKVYSLKTDSGGNYVVDKDVTTENKDIAKISSYNKIDSNSYNNPIENPEVKYYETDPYKGMPAQVPFDTQRGWYVATQASIGGFGNTQKTFQSNGLPNSFWVCNVGQNHRMEFFTGMGDDMCQQFNINTGQALNQFPGLSTSEASALVTKATKALNDAANQYKAGVRSIRINGQQMNVGSPSTGKLGTQCQDFMSPSDCTLLFNVCDPVICPASRCDFGGQYPVPDVIQSGIVGSTLLCLPNFPEVKVPVCLTGIQAGIDSFASVLRSYRDCLQASLDTGQTLGICDEVNSIYMCEFFWKQAAPLANILVPKAFEAVMGEGTKNKGGGEYMNVQGAWTNAKQSVDYFTQTYAVNSMTAFNIRSTEDVGSEVCKSFISVTGPNSLKNLIEPDSPPQFYARFDTFTYSDATVPATDQYKVFYQIYAGQDSGVYYNIYLKGAPTTSYYYTSPTIQVDSGYAVKGQSVSKTKDFTAPTGYKELCVRINDKESCGFKQVTTDFAINSIADSYASDQMLQKDFTTQKDCIGGTADIRSLATANIQGGLQDLANNQIYNNGIVRICSTGNPGMPADVTRYVDVGFCDDSKIRCWLDSRSVNKAITANNLGLKNATLSTLQNYSITSLIGSGQLYSQQDAGTRIAAIAADKESLRTTFDATKAQTVIKAINDLFGKLYMNVQKAQLLWIKGEVLQFVAMDAINKVPATIDNSRTTGTVSTDYMLQAPFNYDQSVPIMKKTTGELTGINIKSGAIYALNLEGTSSMQVGLVFGVIGVENSFKITMDQNLISSVANQNILSAIDGNILNVGSQDIIVSQGTSEKGFVPVVALDLSDNYDINKRIEIIDAKSKQAICVYLSGDKVYTTLLQGAKDISVCQGIGTGEGVAIGEIIERVPNLVYSISLNSAANDYLPADYITQINLLTLNVGEKISPASSSSSSPAKSVSGDLLPGVLSNDAKYYPFVLADNFDPAGNNHLDILNSKDNSQTLFYIRENNTRGINLYSSATQSPVADLVQDPSQTTRYMVRLHSDALGLMPDDISKNYLNQLDGAWIFSGKNLVIIKTNQLNSAANAYAVSKGVDFCGNTIETSQAQPADYSGVAGFGQWILDKSGITAVYKRFTAPAKLAPYVIVSYGNSMSGYDYFGFRCNADAQKIEVKMKITISYAAGTVRNIKDIDWTNAPLNDPIFSEGYSGGVGTIVKAGVSDREKDDITKLMTAADWTEFNSLADGFLSTSSGLVSSGPFVRKVSSLYDGFPGDQSSGTSSATALNSVSSNSPSAVKPDIIKLGIDTYDRTNRIFVTQNGEQTNVYMQYGLVRALLDTQINQRDNPSTLGTLIGTVNVDTLPLITLDKKGIPTYPGNPNRLVVEKKLWDELNGALIYTNKGNLIAQPAPAEVAPPFIVG